MAGRKKVLTIEVVGDADKLDKEVKRSNRSLDSLGKQTKLTASVTSKGFAGMRAAATGAGAGIAGLVLAGKKFVDQASDINESLTKNQALFGANAKMIEAFAKTAADALGISRAEALRAAGTFGGLFSALDIGDRTSATMSKRLVQLAADLASFNNASPEEALESLRSGLAGESEPMRKFNAFLSEGRVEAEAYSSGIAKAGADLTEQQKVTARYALILKDTAKAQGDFTKTKGEDANQTRILKAQYADMTTELGEKLLPAKLRVTRATNKFIDEMQSGTGQGGRFVDTLKDIWREAKPIVTWFGRAAKNVAEFTAEHPGLAKLATGVLAVGVAVKTLRFVSAATGFTALLKAGRVAAAGLKRVLSSAGAAGGEAAAANAASGFAGTTGKTGKFRAAGRTAGRMFGRGIIIGALAGIATLIPDIIAKIRGSIVGAPNRLGESIGRRLGDLLGTNRQAGGLIPGSGRGDIVPAMLEPGEFVIRRKVVDRFGPTFFAGLNDGMGDRTQRYTGGGIVSRANKLDRMSIPYVYGGGHGTRDGFSRTGMDCSASVSYALGVSPRVSGQFTSYGRPGPGSPNDTKVYANAGHVFAVFNGRGWGTSRENPGGGPGWLSYNHRAGFTIRHLEDGGEKGRPDAGDREERGPSASELRDKRRERAERSGSRAVNRITAPFAKGIAAATRGAAGLASTIDQAGTSYGQTERRFGQTDEDLGTPGGKVARLDELGQLAQLKAKTLAHQRKRAGLLRSAIGRLDAQLARLRKARDRSKGAKRAKMNERLKPIIDRRDDLAAELLALGNDIRDTELDIGDLAKDARDVAGTEAETGPTAGERTDDLISLIDARERAGVIDSATAQAQRTQVRQAVLGGTLGPLSERERLQIMGDLRDATAQAAQEMNANTQAIRDLKASIDAQTAVSSSIAGIGLDVAQRALADMVSNQLGYRTNARAMLPGTGALSRL